MSWGTLTIGQLTLSETHTVDDKVNANSGARSVVLTGQEMTFGNLTLGQLRAKAEDLILLMGRTLPVVFERKSDRNGYYRVIDAGTITTHWEGEGSFFTWNLSLELIGPDNAVDIESRMTHIVRANDHSLVGERWHAPAIGAIGYTVGVSSPTPIPREGSEGTVLAYRSIPAANPRWASPVGTFMAGRSRVLVNGIERTGTRVGMVSSDDWELSNSLVRVSWTPDGGGALRVSAWDGEAETWRSKDWAVFSSASTLVNYWDQVTITKNEPELSSLRLVRGLPAGGVVYLDLMLRRGSRFVEGYIQRSTAADELKVRLNTAEPYTTGPGYVVATDPDALGMKFAAGSAKTFSAHASGGLVKASARTLDFWLGAEPNNATAGDTAADLAQQYIAVPNEQTGVITR